MKVTIFICDPAEDIRLAAQEVARDLEVKRTKFPELMAKGKMTGKTATERIRLEQITERVMKQLADNMQATEGWDDEDESDD